MLNHPRYKALGHFPTSPRNSRIKTALPRDETELHGVFVKPCVRCHPTAPARSIGVQRRPIACTYGALRRRSAIRFCVQPRAKSASRQRMHGSLPRGAGRLWVACSLFLRCISLCSHIGNPWHRHRVTARARTLQDYGLARFHWCCELPGNECHNLACSAFERSPVDRRGCGRKRRYRLKANDSTAIYARVKESLLWVTFRLPALDKAGGKGRNAPKADRKLPLAENDAC
jgi:hypothetical protein